MIPRRRRGQVDWRGSLGRPPGLQENLMNRIFGMAMAAGLVLGNASVADAQFSLSIGNPYNGMGLQVGQPYGYGYGLGGVGTTYYGSGYSGYVAPGTTYFSTGTY